MPFFHKTVIQKPDLDTCLAGVIMGVHPDIPVETVLNGATSSQLNHPRVLCLECGGSGMTHLLNLDHHDPEQYYPPACRKALSLFPYPDYELHRLVDYVSMVDEAVVFSAPVDFPSLSSVFCGMLLSVPDRISAFQAGMDILRLVLKKKLNPFANMPVLEKWKKYIQAKVEDMNNLEKSISRVSFFNTGQGYQGGYLRTESFGGTGRLYQMGCRVVILHNPCFGSPPIRKFTIAGNGVDVSGLLKPLNRMEPGWGGRKTIIGSPRSGSLLTPEQVVDLVKSGL